MEDSNKTLALLLVAAIVVSLGGTIVSLNRLGQFQISSATGRAITNGTATITITATTIINITDTQIDFGSGALNGGFENCTLRSNESGVVPSGCGTWTWTQGDHFVMENIGSSTISVEVTGSTPSTFIGGTLPGYQYACADTEGEAGSETYTSTWTTFSGSAQSCVNNLEPQTDRDEAGVYVAVRVGTGASGSKSDIVQFTVV